LHVPAALEFRKPLLLTALAFEDARKACAHLPRERSALSRHARATKFTAAELAQIAHAAGAERLTATFVRAQTRQLESRLGPLAKDLVEGVSKPHAEEARRGRALLDQIGDIARALRERAATPPALAAVEPRLANTWTRSSRSSFAPVHEASGSG